MKQRKRMKAKALAALLRIYKQDLHTYKVLKFVGVVPEGIDFFDWRAQRWPYSQY